jgi:NAD(P)-dependent dehydrogenase (short-subunit alcohol dehydrogenase family)
MENILSSLFSPSGRVALIVGAGGALGAGVARAFAELGATTVLADIKEQAVSAVREEITAANPAAIVDTVVVDITNKESVGAMAAQVVRKFGRIDILINCAGLSYLETAVDFSEEKWDLLMKVNIKGAFLTCQAVGKYMIEQGWGRIVNFSSVRGLQGRAKDLAYAPSKGAINQLTRSLAIEWAPHGVNVNAIAPTFILTNINRDILDDRETHNWVLKRIPKGRLGEVKDIIAPVLFLCSPGAEFVTGHILYVDGGWTAA